MFHSKNKKNVLKTDSIQINVYFLLCSPIPPNSHIKLSLTVHCQGVNFLEHVQAKITLTAQRRGDIVIYLTSPAGTRVTLLTSR